MNDPSQDLRFASILAPERPSFPPRQRRAILLGGSGAAVRQMNYNPVITWNTIYTP